MATEVTKTKFEDTNILEDVSRQLATQDFILAEIHIPKVSRTLFVAVSKFLASIKSQDAAKGIVFKTVDGKFLAGAYIEFVDGHWVYEWTFNQSDMDGVKGDNLIPSTHELFIPFLTSAAAKLYGMKFESESTGLNISNMILDGLIQWLDENVKDDAPASLEQTGVFEIHGEVKDGSIVKSINIDEEIKNLVKDDASYQS